MIFDWNPYKNTVLKAERGINLDDIANLLDGGTPYIIIENPSSNHQDQKVIQIFLKEYAYCIPCVEIPWWYFFKTIYPSRKITKNFKKS